MLFPIFFSFLSGILAMYLILRYKTGTFTKIAQEIIQRAELETKDLQEKQHIELKQKELEHKNSLEKIFEQKNQKIAAREEKIDRQLALIEKKGNEIEKREKEISRLKESLELKEKEAARKIHESLTQLETVAKMSQAEAKKMLLDQCENEIKEETAQLFSQRKRILEEQSERLASEIITTAINRLALPTVSDCTAIIVPLHSPEMKGRVIGREGRNIRILEQKTGVNFVIDDTPNAVVISGYDPVRKEIARIALSDLTQDGRIHPARIEEVVLKAEAKCTQRIKEYGERAASKAGFLMLHQELIQLLGKLHFSYSGGQNMLAHSLEVCQLMGIMAAELKLDSERAKRIGLLHDIGKALSHEAEGSHALIGQRAALKYGESEEVANGIGCHHDEILPITIEGSLCSAADKISAERPGARSEAIEHYFKRSSKLEQLCRQFEGVEKAFAMHAGAEVRVIVEPDIFNDATASILARDIAKKIEKEISYPGKIKITVIREKRVVEYAS